jgi:hypothetical protein
MNIKKALEKVIEWQAAAAQLKPYLNQCDKKTVIKEIKQIDG